RSMRLLSNNPRKLVGVEGYGLTVSEWIPLEIPASESTRRYLKTKKDKLGHKLSSVKLETKNWNLESRGTHENRSARHRFRDHGNKWLFNLRARPGGAAR